MDHPPAVMVSRYLALVIYTHFFELEIMSETYLQLHGQQDHEICFKHPNNYLACMGFEPTTLGLGNSCRQTQIVCTPTA